MSAIRCPYCGSCDLDWRTFTDQMKWSDDDSGLIITSGLRCKNVVCNGLLGFSVEMGFTIGDEYTYYDEDGAEIEEE